MSDVNIPGVSNNLNINKLINDQMKLARMPVDNLKKQVETLQKQKTAWQDINKSIGSVLTSANALYSFNNPFEDKVASSSDSNVLTATANRTAQAATDTIKVERIATADSFISRSLPDNYTIPAGTYTIGVGAKKVTFQWTGGSLTDFAKIVNQKAGSLVRAAVVNNTATTQVFQITAKATGEANKLDFEGAAKAFAVDAGIIKPTGGAARTIELTPSEVAPWTKPLAGMDYSVANGTLTLGPGSEVSLPVTPPVAAEKDLVLEIKLQVTDIPHGPAAQPTAPSGPSIPSTGSIQYKGLTIQSEPSKAPLPPYQAPPPPKTVSDLNVLYLSDGTNTYKLPAVQDTPGEQTIQVPLSQYLQTLAAVDVRNENTYRKITIDGIRVYNPNARAGYTPVNPVSQAGDALLDLNGIQARRSGNTIDNLIPGVTLTLNHPSPAPVTLNVAPDTKRIHDAILTFVGDYNRLMGNLNIYTSNDPKVINELTYLTPQEQQQAQQNLGLFQGDITIQEMQNRLENDVMNPYPTDLGRKLALLAQIGISTDVSKSFSGIQMSKLRGYLQVDDQKLQSALQTELPAIKQLFGNDTTGNFVVNTGVAYTVDRFLTAFNQVNGIIPDKLQSYDQQITQDNQQIATLQQQLTQKEQQLRAKYSQMEGALQQLQQSSQSLNSLNGNMLGGSSGSSSSGVP